MLMEHRLRTRHMGLRECPRLCCGSLVASWDAQRTTGERRVRTRGGAEELDHSRRQAGTPKNQHLFLVIPLFFRGWGGQFLNCPVFSYLLSRLKCLFDLYNNDYFTLTKPSWPTGMAWGTFSPSLRSWCFLAEAKIKECRVWPQKSIKPMIQ